MIEVIGFFSIGIAGYIFGYASGKSNAWEDAKNRYRWNKKPFDHAANTDFRAYYEWREKHNAGKEFGQ